MTSIPLNQSQAAELAGITARRMRQIGKDDPDKPHQNADGSYPCKEFGKWLKRRHLAGLGVGADGMVFDYELEKARLTHHQANNAALDEELKRGVLIRAEQVEKLWTSMAMTMRSSLLALPVRIAHVAISAESLREVEDAVRDEVYLALGALSKNEPITTDTEELMEETETAAEANG